MSKRDVVLLADMTHPTLTCWDTDHHYAAWIVVRGNVKTVKGTENHLLLP